MSRLIATAGVIALAALLGWQGYHILHQQSTDVFASCRSTVVPAGQIGGRFSLLDTKGNPATDVQVLAKPALVYFGYASCSDVCPLDNARNVAAVDLLAKQAMAVTPVFISVDPSRDTPEVLADYAGNFAGLVALTGSQDQTAAAVKAFKVYYQLPEKRGPGYAVDHTTMTYLMLPKIGFADVFQRDATAEDVATRTACFLKAL